MRSAILLALVLASVSESTGENSGFLATFPTSVLAGSKVQLCVRFFNIRDQVDLRVEDSIGALDKHEERIETGKLDGVTRSSFGLLIQPVLTRQGDMHHNESEGEPR
jgi:hypothetical protein